MIGVSMDSEGNFSSRSFSMSIEKPEDLDEDKIDAEDIDAEVVDELGLSGADLPTADALDDDDDPNDERDDENEAPVREVRDTTEAPEEFKVDDEDRV
jgi:hypothetical protein